MKKHLILLLSILFIASCGNPKKEGQPDKKGSSGKTLEVLLVADKDIYRGDTKQLVDSLFCSPQPCLPQAAQRFDLVNIPLSSYKNTEMFQNHRNIVICDINPDNPDKVFMHIDQYAAPQVVFDFAASSRAELERLLCKYHERLLEEIYRAEHRRVIKAFKGIAGYEVNKAVKEQFGFGLTFSNEFAIAKQEGDFGWIRKEAKDFGIGVIVHTFPYTDTKAFEERTILDRLDTMMRRHVPGPAEGSYMGLERRTTADGHYLAPIESRTVDFNGSSYCVETRGCWRLFGDFMGGPFVTYTLLDPDQKKVVMLTGYVYCPRNRPPKRDLLMQVEGICWSLQF